MKFFNCFLLFLLCIILNPVSHAYNPDHLSKFDKTGECPGCDLSGLENFKEYTRCLAGMRINLKGANLQKTDLSGTDLKNSDLTDANLTNANLEDANLQGANLDGTIMVNANCRGTQFHNANWQKVDASFANFTKANFDGAYIKNSDFTESNLTGITTNVEYITYLDMSFSHLSGLILCWCFPKYCIKKKEIQTVIENTDFSQTLQANLELKKFEKSELNNHFSEKKITEEEWKKQQIERAERAQAYVDTRDVLSKVKLIKKGSSDNFSYEGTLNKGSEECSLIWYCEKNNLSTFMKFFSKEIKCKEVRVTQSGSADHSKKLAEVYFAAMAHLYRNQERFNQKV